MTRPHFKIVLLIMLTVFSCTAWAGTYDPLLLRTQASIFPKIILLDKDLSSKITDNEIVLTIVSTGKDKYIAQYFKGLLEDKYPDGLGNKNLVVNTVIFEEFDKNSQATAYIVLRGAEPLFKEIVSHASGNKRIVFSYSYTDFEYNALISLYVKEKTYVYLNKSAIKLYDIKFLSIFYKITKIIE